MVVAPTVRDMHRPPNTTARAQRLLDEVVGPAVLGARRPFAVAATAEHLSPMTLAAAAAAPVEPFAIGAPWGPAWHSRWFRLTAVVPTAWPVDGTVAHIDLGFSAAQPGFQAEGLVWRDGRVVHAVQPDRRLVHLPDVAPGESVALWMEAVAYPHIFQHAFRPTPQGDPRTASAEPLHHLAVAELAVHEPEVDDLALEVSLVLDLVAAIDDRDPLRAQALRALDEVVAAVDPRAVAATAAAARAALAPVLARRAAPGGHRIVATGHAHLDTAWLWPVSEARRKTLRTFANAVALLDRHPDHRVTVSQAQQYAWIATDAPDVFARVRELVEAGRWEVAGGMWVETDLNLPSGESLARQFVHGQRAFTEWFGRPCPGAFLPDDFGYPGSFPQLARLAGCEWFFTQKLSWNDTNKPPHHTFWWQGIDGSRVLAHMSPVETYNSTLVPGELLHAQRTFADHALSDTSLACFGHGDGGGGATDEMVRRARLVADWQPVPQVRFGGADEFFAGELARPPDAWPVWVGELYFELHRGTASSQVGTKQGNRTCERLLHEAELWAAATGTDLTASLDRWWKTVLTQHFHDILPGSSIAWVHRDAEETFAAVAAEIEASVTALVGVPGPADDDAPITVANPAPVAVAEVAVVGGRPRWVEAPAFGRGTAADRLPADVVPVSVDDNVIGNGLVRLTFDDDGLITSLVLLSSGRELVPAGRRANLLRLLRDQPAMWDAWDVDLADRDLADDLTRPERVAIVESSPLRVVLEVEHAFGSSRLVQRVIVRAGTACVEVELDVDWHEDARRLQVVWPLDVHAHEATCGIQFGHVRRPRHANTSWDVARFEVCAHRYVHVGEHGFGVALLGDGPHGYDVGGDALRMTLLRAPSFPDPSADRGRHRLAYALWAHEGDAFDAGLEDLAHRRAHPVRAVGEDGAPGAPLVRLDAPGALVSAVKPAEDGSGDVVVRVWETHGGRAAGALLVAGARRAWVCDLLEAPGDEVPVVADDGAIAVALRPFQIATYRVRGPGRP